MSIITQSGAFGSALLDFCAYSGIGVAKFISIGNRIDVNEIELLEYLDSDPQTRAIGMYLESTADGKKFMEVVKKIKKPLVVFKAGKTKKGTEAVASHTGALAGEYEIYKAAFKQANIIEAQSVEDLLDFTNILSKQPTLNSRKIAIITDGGGFGIAAADAAIQSGLELPEPSQNLATKIKQFLPSYASIKNPIDLTGDATSERYANVLETVLSSNEYSGVLIIALLQISTLDESIVSVIESLKKYGKPIAVCMAGGAWTHERAVKLEASGIPVFPTPERAARALSVLYRKS
jgi:acyl-CoA synthetase (NDP forming)